MNFEWSLPTRIVFGARRFQSAHKFLRGFGKRAFIVTSSSFIDGGARADHLENLKRQLKSIGVEHQVFGQVEPNPRTETIDRVASLVRDYKPRYIIALGGGSVMDAAKCLALLAVNEGHICDFAYRGPGQKMTPFNHALPIVCMPTVAATSSETSLYAVVTDWARRRKTTVFGKPLIPTLSIIDPELTYSLSPEQTVHGAFDMITHVIESYLSTTEPAPIQDRMTEALIETIITHLPRVLDNPSDELGRSQLSWCGALALSGVLNGREGGWPIHALEHGLSAFTDVAHGKGLAMLLPRVMAFDSKVIDEKISAFNKRIFGAPDLESGLFRYMKNVGAWVTLDQVIPNNSTADEVIQNTLDHAFEIDAVLKRDEEPYLNNIIPITRKDAILILGNCLN